MKRYLLLGTTINGKELECIGETIALKEVNESGLRYILTKDYKNELKYYDCIYVVDEELKVYYVARGFSNGEMIKIKLEIDGDLSKYKLVTIDFPEIDDIVTLNEVFETDLFHR